MMIGPAPIIMTDSMSVLFGIYFGLFQHFINVNLTLKIIQPDTRIMPINLSNKGATSCGPGLASGCP